MAERIRSTDTNFKAAAKMMVADNMLNRMTNNLQSSFTEKVKKVSAPLATFLNTSHNNRYQLYDDIVKTDPMIAGGLTFISNVEGKSYDKVVAMADYNREDKPLLKKYEEDFNLVLDELGLNSLMADGSMVYNLNKNGDVVYEIIWVDEDKKTEIDHLEMLPLEYLTIRDNTFDTTFENNKNAGKSRKSYPITRRDYYLLNERHGSNLYDSYRKIETEDIWHISLNADGNKTKDIMRRWTWGVWGKSPLESLEIPIKLQYLLQYAFSKSEYMNINRLAFSLDMGKLAEMEIPAGLSDTELKALIKTRQDAVAEIIDGFADSLVSYDIGSGMYTQIQPDEFLTLPSTVKLTEIGGRSTSSNILNVMKWIDQCKGSALGLPILFFGYNDMTFAAAYIARNFMTARGYGQTNAIINSAKPIARRILRARNNGTDPYPKRFDEYIFPNIVIEDYQAETAYANIAMNMWDKRLITRGRALERIGEPSLDEAKFPQMNDEFAPNTKQQPGMTQNNTGDPNSIYDKLSDMLTSPFGPYKNFNDCVSKNQDKDSPEGYCAIMMRQIEEGK